MSTKTAAERARRMLKAIIGDERPAAPPHFAPTPTSFPGGPRKRGTGASNYVRTVQRGSENNENVMPHPVGSWVRIMSRTRRLNPQTSEYERSAHLSEPHLITGHRIVEHAFRQDQHNQHIADADGFYRHRTQAYNVINPRTNKYRVVDHADIVPHTPQPD